MAKGNPPQLYDLVKKEVMKMERGLPILEGVELNKYKSLVKTVVSTGNNIESKITPLRKKRMTRKRRPYVKLLTHGWKNTKEIVQTRIQSDPLEAVTAIMRLKMAVPSVKEFDEPLAGP